MVVGVIGQDQATLLAQTLQDIGLVGLHVLTNPVRIHAVVVKNTAGKESMAGQPLLAQCIGHFGAGTVGLHVGLHQCGQVCLVGRCQTPPTPSQPNVGTGQVRQPLGATEKSLAG